MIKFIMLHISELNFIIATLAFLAAIYSIFYTRKFNRHKISVNDGVFYSDEINLPIAWFEIHNISPVPVTIVKIEFFNLNNHIHPVMDYDPVQTYSSAPYGLHIPDVIPEYKYSDPLTSPQILQPHSSLELGYHFNCVYDCLTVTVTCKERIHRFKKKQSFILHLPDVGD